MAQPQNDEIWDIIIIILPIIIIIIIIEIAHKVTKNTQKVKVKIIKTH